MVFCCCEPLLCAKILTGTEIVVIVINLILNIIFDFWIPIIVIRFIILVCLCVEMFGILKNNFGLVTFSCIFRVLQVIAYVLYCIYWIYLFLSAGVVVNFYYYIYFALSVLQLGYAIYRTVMQFVLKSKIKNLL